MLGLTCMVGAVDGADPGGAFRPAGKSFKERLTAFLADAKATYGVTISRKAEFRKAEDAQKWHVAHMIAYNSFESRKPARSEGLDGRHVIAWSHLQDPATKWEHVRWEDYLRDEDGEVPVKQGAGWAPGHLPTRTRPGNGRWPSSATWASARRRTGPASPTAPWSRRASRAAPSLAVAAALARSTSPGWPATWARPSWESSSRSSSGPMLARSMPTSRDSACTGR